MAKRKGLFSLLAAFAILWVPLGQQAFLLEHWMKLGVFMAPFLLFIAFAFRSERQSEVDAQILSLLLLITYIAHQFEEHWIDLYGNSYAFKPFLNAMLLERLGGDDGSAEVLSDAGVFVINTSLVWLVGALAIWRAPENVFPALCMAAVVLVNAFSHIAAALFSGAYNPGLLTAVVLFLPASLGAYAWLVRSAVANTAEVGASVTWGLLGHVVMVAGMIASGWFGALPEPAYFSILILWSILPVFMFRRAA